MDGEQQPAPDFHRQATHPRDRDPHPEPNRRRRRRRRIVIPPQLLRHGLRKSHDDTAARGPVERRPVRRGAVQRAGGGRAGARLVAVLRGARRRRRRPQGRARHGLRGAQRGVRLQHRAAGRAAGAGDGEPGRGGGTGAEAAARGQESGREARLQPQGGRDDHGEYWRARKTGEECGGWRRERGEGGGGVVFYQTPAWQRQCQHGFWCWNAVFAASPQCEGSQGGKEKEQAEFLATGFRI